MSTRYTRPANIQVRTVEYTILSRIAIWVACGYAIWQGVWICLGGIERWGGPAYQIIRQLPGSPASWGAPLAVFGVVGLTGSLTRRFWVKFVGLAGIVVWSFCFAAGAGGATIADPRAGTTGGPAYVVIGLLVLVLCFYDERKRR